MGLIKREQLDALQIKAGQQAEPLPDVKQPDWASAPPARHHDEAPAETDAAPQEDDWDWDAFLAGDIPDRRQTDERRGEHRREADQHLLATAHDEADTIRQNAYQSGYTDGVASAEADIDALKTQFAQLLEGRDTLVDDMVKQLGPLAVAIAEKILKTEVSCDEQLTERLARDTLQKAGRDVKTVMIKVHPEQLTMVRAAFRDHPPEGLLAELSVVDDDTVDWGSCMIETDSGMIDGRFSTQLNLLQKLLY
jgi:flagellar biosynthesis/type III secretory pathway protein FliH